MGIAEVRASCGRYYLCVAGIAVAMQGDQCRAELPESCFDPIPERELAQASIGSKPASELPIRVVRFFRGDQWTEKMLRYAADQINSQEKRR